LFRNNFSERINKNSEDIVMSNPKLSKNVYLEKTRSVVEYIITALINIIVLTHMMAMAISMTSRNYRKPNWQMSTYLGKY
jgi:hypothetical protein